MPKRFYERPVRGEVPLGQAKDENKKRVAREEAENRRPKTGNGPAVVFRPTERFVPDQVPGKPVARAYISRPLSAASPPQYPVIELGPLLGKRFESEAGNGESDIAGNAPEQTIPVPTVEDSADQKPATEPEPIEVPPGALGVAFRYRPENSNDGEEPSFHEIFDAVVELRSEHRSNTEIGKLFGKSTTNAGQWTSDVAGWYRITAEAWTLIDKAHTRGVRLTRIWIRTLSRCEPADQLEMARRKAELTD
jgi:hypothetical protein